MSKFKVGDRVIGDGIEDGKNVSGKTGTIAWCGDTGKFYWVRFDENVDGWSDDACGIPAGHGWTVEGSKLKLVEGAQPIQSSRKTLPLSSVHITSAFGDHLPDPKKITKCYEFYKANGEFNKDIVINMRNVLVDGYVAYLIAKMVGMENVPVLQTNSTTLDKPKKAKKADFDWEAFKAGEIVVHCDTEEKAKVFLTECDQRGYCWRTGRKLTAVTNWKTYREKTIYDNDGGFGFGSVEGSHVKSCRAKIVNYPFVTVGQPVDEKPAKAAPRFKVGDKVKCVKNVTSVSSKNSYIGNVYEIRNIQEANQYGCKYGIGEVYVVYENELEPYSEPAATSTEPDKQEVVKLYCVKDRPLGFNLTKGKAYTFDSVSGITDDDGFIARNYESYSAFTKANPDIAKHLVPLVKRPAKVGEWVYICDAQPLSKSQTYCNGDIFKITHMHEVFKHNVCCDEQKDWFEDAEYLVLDGYQPEPEKPKYYNGKVVCVKAGCFHASGKIYEVKDGVVNDNSGKFDYNSKHPATSVEQLNSTSVSQFIELKQ